MELAGLSFPDSPGSGSLKFLEPMALSASSLSVSALNPIIYTNPKKNQPSAKIVLIAGYPNKLGSHNRFSTLVIVDHPYIKVSLTLRFRFCRARPILLRLEVPRKKSRGAVSCVTTASSVHFPLMEAWVHFVFVAWHGHRPSTALLQKYQTSFCSMLCTRKQRSCHCFGHPPASKPTIPPRTFALAPHMMSRKVLRKMGALPGPHDGSAEAAAKLRDAFLSQQSPSTWQTAPRSDQVRILLCRLGFLEHSGSADSAIWKAMVKYMRSRGLPRMKTYNGCLWRILYNLGPSKNPTYTGIVDFRK